MSKNIPEVGEVFNGYVPANMQVQLVKVGSASTNDLVVGDTGEYTLVTVSEPIAIFGMWTQVETAFTASVTATIGDSGGADRFFVTGTIDPTNTGAVLVTSSGLTVPYVYSAGQDLKITVGGATVAAGLCNVYIQYAILDD